MVTFTVTPEGGVDQLSFNSDTLDDSEMLACMRERLKVRYGIQQVGGCVTVQVPLNFVPKKHDTMPDAAQKETLQPPP